MDEWYRVTIETPELRLYVDVVLPAGADADAVAAIVDPMLDELQADDGPIAIIATPNLYRATYKWRPLPSRVQ